MQKGVTKLLRTAGAEQSTLRSQRSALEEGERQAREQETAVIERESSTAAAAAEAARAARAAQKISREQVRGLPPAAACPLDVHASAACPSICCHLPPQLPTRTHPTSQMCTHPTSPMRMRPTSPMCVHLAPCEQEKIAFDARVEERRRPSTRRLDTKAPLPSRAEMGMAPVAAEAAQAERRAKSSVEFHPIYNPGPHPDGSA